MNNVQVPGNASGTTNASATTATDAAAGTGSAANNPLFNPQLMNMFNQLSVSYFCAGIRL